MSLPHHGAVVEPSEDLDVAELADELLRFRDHGGEVLSSRFVRLHAFPKIHTPFGRHELTESVYICYLLLLPLKLLLEMGKWVISSV